MLRFVMVFNLSQPYDSSKLKGVIEFQTVDYHGINYGIWIFRGGEFTNRGDGGYINWAFWGSFERTGKSRKTVRFMSSGWSCLQHGKKVGEVNIWWGDRSGDGAWACNQWQPTCKDGGGNCTAKSRWIRPR